MDYNSNRKKMAMPEYGRNIQNMVDYVLTITDRTERNKATQTIIDIMGNMYPYLRDINDFKHKLWDHLAIMSDFKLDIDSPYETPNKSTFSEAPKKVPYSSHKLKFRHYGVMIEKLIEKAASFEPGEEKEVLIKLLANQMKKCYLTWNKDAVDDEKIYEDLNILSGGRIQRNNIELTETKDIVNNRRKKKNIQNKNSSTQNNNRFKRKRTSN